MKALDLLPRVLSAIVLLPPLIWAIAADNPAPFSVIIWIAGVIAQAEFYAMSLGSEPRWVHILGIICGASLGAVLITTGTSLSGMTVAIVVIIIASSACQLRPNLDVNTTSESLANNLLRMVFGALFTQIPLTPLAWLKARPRGIRWISLILSTTWFSDTGAYFTGRALGKHSLHPRISPNKSVEGALGGIIAAVVAALIAQKWYLPELSWVQVGLISIPGSILGQVGDLTESLFKRAYGAKDSGKIIPGHGGVLDRIDALLFVTPYVYWIARLAR